MKSIQETEKQKSELTEFIHEAFCINGTVSFLHFADIPVAPNKIANGMVFELNDKKRGMFYVGVFTNKSNKSEKS